MLYTAKTSKEYKINYYNGGRKIEPKRISNNNRLPAKQNMIQ